MFLPTQPRPASPANSRSKSGAVSTTPRTAAPGVNSAMEVGQGMQSPADQVVIVARPRHSGRSPLPWPRHGRLHRAVAHGQHQQAAGTGQDVLGVLVGGGPAGHVFHLPGETSASHRRKSPSAGGATAGVAPARSKPSRRASRFSAAVRSSGSWRDFRTSSILPHHCSQRLRLGIMRWFRSPVNLGKPRNEVTS